MALDLYQRGLDTVYWFVSNKLLLRKLLVTFLIILIISVEIIFFFTLVYATVVKQADYQQMIINLVSTRPEYAVIRQTGQPQDLQFGLLSSFVTAEGTDVITELTNQNPDWWAEFEYQYATNSGFTESRKSFILPNQTKRLLALNLDAQSVGDIQLNNVVWTKQLDYEKIKEERFNFSIENIEKLDPLSEISESTPINRIRFEAVNNSAFNFRNVVFKIFIFSGSQISAINQVTAANFMSGQKRILEATFFQNIGSANNIEITPEVNFLDQKQILKIE